MGVHPIYARLQNAFSFEKIANMTVFLDIFGLVVGSTIDMQVLLQQCII